MLPKIEPIETVWAHCPECGALKRADVVARYEHRDNDLEEVPLLFDVVRCRGCEKPFFRTLYDDPFLDDEDRAPQYWPAIAPRRKPEWIKALDRRSVESAWYDRLQDFYACLDSNILVPAAIAARTTFEIATAELGLEEGQTFSGKLDALAANGYLSVTDRDYLSVLVEAGNAAAHRGWMPRPEELYLIASILESFLERIFVHREASERLRDRIPGRSVKGASGTKKRDRR